MSPKDLFTKIFGTRFQRELKRIRPVVDAIHGHEDRLKGFSDAELRAQTPKLRGLIAERTGALGAEVERLKREKHDCPDAAQRATLSDQLSRAETTYVKALQGALSDMLPEAFATVREACRRLVGSEVVVTGIWCRTTSSSSAASCCTRARSRRWRRARARPSWRRCPCT